MFSEGLPVWRALGGNDAPAWRGARPQSGPGAPKEVSASFDRFCLAAGIETLGAMMEADVEVACGPRHSRSEDRRGHRCGRTAGKLGFHAGKVAIERPRVRGLDGKELPLAHSPPHSPANSWSPR
jgi:hypothetical protein